MHPRNTVGLILISSPMQLSICSYIRTVHVSHLDNAYMYLLILTGQNGHKLQITSCEV